MAQPETSFFEIKIGNVLGDDRQRPKAGCPTYMAKCPISIALPRSYHMKKHMPFLSHHKERESPSDGRDWAIIRSQTEGVCR
jgi:hypothetical protein